MGEDFCGSSHHSSDNRPIVHKKINDIIHNSFHRDIAKLINQDLLTVMNKSARLLKKAFLIEARSEIEYDKYSITSYPAFLWQEKCVASFYFFVTILGYIDKNIDKEKKNIKLNENFLFTDTTDDHQHKDRIYKSKCLIKNYLCDRKEILDEYKSLIDMNYIHPIMLEALEDTPSYNKFDILYNNQKDNETQLHLNIQLINAYNLGYLFDNETYDKVMNKYKSLFNEIVIEKYQDESIVLNKKLDNSKKKKKS